MADLIINSSEDELINSLDFRLPTTSKYVMDRRLVRFYPSGASDFSPTGVRTARILLSGLLLLGSTKCPLRSAARALLTFGPLEKVTTSPSPKC